MFLETYRVVIKYGHYADSDCRLFGRRPPFSVPVSGAAQTPAASDLADWRADLVENWAIPNPNQNLWFNPAAFAISKTPACGLMKMFDIKDRIHMQFRWEVFNVRNSPRQMQFFLRVGF